MTSLRLSFCCLAALCLLANQANAQARGTLTLNLVENSPRGAIPVAGARVAVFQGSEIFQGVSGRGGGVALRGLAYNVRYNINVTKPGYNTFKNTVLITPTQNSTTLRLQPGVTPNNPRFYSYQLKVVYSGNPLPGHPLRFVDQQSGKVVASGKTDRQGNYVNLRLLESNYRVELQAPKDGGRRWYNLLLNGNKEDQVEFTTLATAPGW